MGNKKQRKKKEKQSLAILLCYLENIFLTVPTFWGEAF